MSIRRRALLPVLPVLFALAGLSCSGGAPAEEPRSPESPESQAVRTGARVLLDDHLDELAGRRVGLLMNPVSRVDGAHMLDTLLAREVNVTALFAAEHGFRGEAGAGETIEDGVDRATGLPVFSLYGETRRPTPAMMDSVDLILADLPELGARFYTYGATLGYVLEAAAESGVAVWVLDRPLPSGGDPGGWGMDEAYRSFVGRFPLPMIHGLTLGELASMMTGEEWIDFEAEPELRVIPMERWERDMTWPETGLPWVSPSPNLPRFENAHLYLGTVLFEGTTLSEGRGTPDPFLTIGSPRTRLSAGQIASLDRRFPGVRVEEAEFTPRSLPGKAPSPKHRGELCRGVSLTLTDPGILPPLEFGLALLKLMLENSEGARITPYMQNLTGVPNDSLRAWLERGDLPGTWQEEVEAFRERREPYLLY